MMSPYQKMAKGSHGIAMLPLEMRGVAGDPMP